MTAFIEFIKENLIKLLLFLSTFGISLSVIIGIVKIFIDKNYKKKFLSNLIKETQFMFEKNNEMMINYLRNNLLPKKDSVDGSAEAEVVILPFESYAKPEPILGLKLDENHKFKNAITKTHILKHKKTIGFIKNKKPIKKSDLNQRTFYLK